MIRMTAAQCWCTCRRSTFVHFIQNSKSDISDCFIECLNLWFVQWFNPTPETSRQLVTGRRPHRHGSKLGINDDPVNIDHSLRHTGGYFEDTWTFAGVSSGTNSGCVVSGRPADICMCFCGCLWQEVSSSSSSAILENNNRYFNLIRVVFLTSDREVKNASVALQNQTELTFVLLNQTQFFKLHHLSLLFSFSFSHPEMESDLTSMMCSVMMHRRFSFRLRWDQIILNSFSLMRPSWTELNRRINKCHICNM